MDFLYLIPIIVLFAFYVNWKYKSWLERKKIVVKYDRRGKYGYIYFYRGKGENPFQVKIGRAKDWRQRLKSSRTSVGARGFYIYGIVRVQSDVWAETYIHRRFADDRYSKKNEWFRLSFALWIYILRIRDKDLTNHARKELAI